MSHWNYRAIRRPVQDTEDFMFEIHEVYYSDDHKIDAWTEGSVKPSGETEYELHEDILHFLEALRHPVLEEKQIDGEEVLREVSCNSTINNRHIRHNVDDVLVNESLFSGIETMAIHRAIKCNIQEMMNKEDLSKTDMGEQLISKLDDLEKYIIKRKKKSPEFAKDFESGHEDFKRILENVPDRKPLPGDEL